MTIEDFFNLTEMKDGLTASDQVKELVNIMLKDRDCVLTNVGDATRQWSTVASTLAATEDKDCLDLFVQLDGISFINEWLKDAQKLANEPSDSSAEEPITALLHAVEKLHVNYEQSVAYGIRPTVEKLISHCSCTVKERARALFGSWKQQGDGEGDISPSIEVTYEKNVQPGDEMVPHICSMDVLPGKVDRTVIQQDDEKALREENMKDVDRIPGNGGEPRLCHLDENSSYGTSTAAVPGDDGMLSNQFGGNEKQMREVASPSCGLGAKKISPFPVEKASEPVTGRNVQTNTDMEVDNNLKELAAVSQDQGQVCDANVLDGSGNEDNLLKLHCGAGDEGRLLKLQCPDTSSSTGKSDSMIGEHSSAESGGLTNDTYFLKTKTKGNDAVNKSRSGFELNYGMFDALEVACQVANEVEREVEGQRETSCSPSHKVPEAETSHPDSLASVHGSKTKTEESANEVSREEGELSDDQKDLTAISFQVLDGGQEPDSKSDKEIVDFDLNQEICSDDTERPLDAISAAVSIVSASRAAAAPGFPTSPLQFEGAHGWKGSAANSAFRPASPRKAHDCDKIDNNSNHRQNFLDFDLNIAEDGYDKTADLVPGKQILHYGDSSGEAKINLDLNRMSNEADTPLPDWRINERLLPSGNGHHNASPSPSLMQQPLRNFDLNDQPSFLNESSELNFFAKSSSSQKLSPSVGPRSSNDMITIMGTKVEVNQKDFFSQPPSLPNGRILEPTLDINIARGGGVSGIGSAVPYPPPNMFTDNRLATGPIGTFSPVLYGLGGPIPYMVDSRGAPVIPQLLGSASVAPAPYSQPPFTATGIYGMHALGLNGPGPSRPNFDLSLGLTGERVDREPGGLRQFLGPIQNQSLDELRSNFQPSSSIVTGKRKEPDGGWEAYPFDYKHHYSQWK